MAEDTFGCTSSGADVEFVTYRDGGNTSVSSMNQFINKAVSPSGQSNSSRIHSFHHNEAIELNEVVGHSSIDNKLPYPVNGNYTPGIIDYYPNSQSFQQEPPKDHPNDSEEKKSTLAYRVHKLFRYADSLDFFLMICGTLLALCQGAALPTSFLIHADILNAMNEYSSCEDIAQIPMQDWNLTVFNKSVSQVTNYEKSEVYLHENVSSKCGHLAMIGLGIFFAGLVQSSAWKIAGERQMYRIRTKLFRAILSKDVEWFDERGSDSINQTLFDQICKMEKGMASKVPETISWLATTVAGFAVAFSGSWLVSLVICSLVPVFFAISIFMIRLIRKYKIHQDEAYADADSIAREAILNWRTVLAFNKQEYEVKRYGQQLETSQRMGMIKTIVSGASQGVMFLILYSMFGLAFWWGYSHDSASGGTILQIIICVMMATMALGNAWPNFEDFFTAIEAAEEVFSVVDGSSRIDNFDDSGTWVESLRGDIHFEDVAFAYPSKPDRLVLQSVSLAIPRGKTVALVGSLGCGKSTIVQLLLRFYDVTSGRVTVDNVDVRDLNVRWFRQQIGLVSQHPVLFNTTVKDNIRMGAVDQAFVSDDDVVTACRLSNAHDFITRLPMGYDTMVGERGAQLSAGQKQRIALARALVSNPRILVLDEATSCLDSSSEAIVQQALEKARMGRTTLIIAQRLSAVRNADLIAVLDRGVIGEIGTHDQLIDREGLYFRLIESQQLANDPEGEGFNESEVDLANELAYNNSEEDVFANKSHESSVLAATFNSNHPILQRLNSTNSVSSRGKNGGKGFLSRRPSLGVIHTLERGDLVDGLRHDRVLNRFQLIGMVLQWSRPEYALSIFCCIVSILAGAVQPTSSFVMSEFIISFCPHGQDETFKMLVGVIVLLGAIQVIFLTGQHLAYALIGERLTARMRCSVLGRILCMDAAWLDRPENQSASLVTVLATDCINIQGISSIRLCSLVSMFVVIGTAVIYSLLIEYRVTLVLAGAMSAIAVAVMSYSYFLRSVKPKDANENEETTVIAIDAIDNMRTVMSMAAEPYFLEQFSLRFHSIRNRTIKQATILAGIYSFILAAILWAAAVTFWLGAWLMIVGETEFKQVIRVYILISFSDFSRYSTVFPDESKARKAAMNIARIVEEKNAIDTEDPETGESLAARQLSEDRLLENRSCKGKIEFKNVCFSYPSRPGVPVLNGISFVVNPGQRVALCGPSGGGKSTVIKLIQRLYDPKSGFILIDGIDLQSCNVRWLRSNIAHISQEPVLFSSSVRENVAYGCKQDFPEAYQIEGACRAAKADDFISRLREGYSTQLGDEGGALNEGQKQRLSIARAIIRQPAILLLDEPTSALDAENESLVQEAVSVAERSSTCLVIAHRLSAIENADKIVVFEHGSVVEEGTHAELMRLRGTYFRLLQFQQANTSVVQDDLIYK